MHGVDAGHGVAEVEPPGPVRLGPLGAVTSRSDLVEAALRQMIIAGRFRPGETLVERQVAAMLGVSKTPVREALIALASTGLVEVSRNRGVVVCHPGAEDMWKIFELRLLLEPWAIGRAAALHPAEAAAEAMAALAESADLLDAGDQARLSLVNRRFHRAIYSRCGNDLVARELDRMQDLVSVGLVLIWERSSWPVWREEHREHEGIVASVRAGDAASATRAAREHIERVMALFERESSAEG